MMTRRDYRGIRSYAYAHLSRRLAPPSKDGAERATHSPAPRPRSVRRRTDGASQSLPNFNVGSFRPDKVSQESLLMLPLQQPGYPYH